MIVCSQIFTEQFVEQKKFLNLYPAYKEMFVNYTKRTDLDLKIEFDNFTIREDKPILLDIFISIWIIGQTWHELKKLFVLGIYDYLYSSSNTFNLSMNILYIAAYGLKYSSMIMVNQMKGRLNEDFIPPMNNVNQDLTDSILTTVSSISNQNQSHAGFSFWEMIQNLNSSDLKTQEEIYMTFYWLNSGKFK